MLNQLVLVGRLVDNISEDSEENKVITLAVPRCYKNTEGCYETDFIPVVVFGSLAANLKEYCKKGDLIGIKGRVERAADSDLRIIAEKVTFLSTNKGEENE